MTNLFEELRKQVPSDWTDEDVLSILPREIAESSKEKQTKVKKEREQKAGCSIEEINYLPISQRKEAVAILVPRETARFFPGRRDKEALPWVD